MLMLNTVYNVSTLRTIKMFSPKRLDSKYTVSINPIIPELVYRKEDQFDPSIYIETRIKNGSTEDESSIILTENDCIKLIKELENAVETLKEKKCAKEQLEKYLSETNLLKDTHSIVIEYFSEYTACDSDLIKIYKISVIEPEHGLEKYSFLMPLYLVGIKETDYRKISDLIQYQKDKIAYGPKLLEFGERYKKERIKEMGKIVDNRINGIS